MSRHSRRRDEIARTVHKDLELEPSATDRLDLYLFATAIDQVAIVAASIPEIGKRTRSSGISLAFGRSRTIILVALTSRCRQIGYELELTCLGQGSVTPSFVLHS